LDREAFLKHTALPMKILQPTTVNVRIMGVFEGRNRRVATFITASTGRRHARYCQRRQPGPRRALREINSFLFKRLHILYPQHPG